MRKLIAGLAVVGLVCVPAFGQVIGQNPIVTSSPTISTLTTGTILDVTSSVSADNRYVTIRVRATQSSLEGLDMFNLSGRRLNGGGVVGGGGGGGGGGIGGGGGGAAAPAIAKNPPKAAEAGSIAYVQTDKALLAAEVPAMTLQGKSMREAVKSLGEATKSNVVLGLRGLERAGVDLNAGHDFTIAHGTLKEALEVVVKTAAPKADVVITAEDGVVQVMSQAQADNVVVTKTYYVEDLIWNLPQIIGKHTDLNAVTKDDAVKAAGGAAAGAGGVTNYEEVVGYRAPGRPAAMAAGKERVSTNIIEMITSTVRPEIWKVNGGKIGEIAVVGNQATVTAPMSVQAVLDGPKHFDPNARPLYINYSPTSGASVEPPR